MAHGTPNGLRQVSFRGRWDDGILTSPTSGTGASWITGINQNWYQRPGRKFRIRVLIDCYRFASFTAQLGLRFSHNNQAFQDISDVTSVVKVVNSDYYAHATDTAQWPGSLGTGLWADPTNGFGVGADGYGYSGTATFLGGPIENEMETEWCLEIVSNDVEHGDTIEFEWTQSGSNLSRGYLNSPIIIIDKSYTFMTTATGTPQTNTNELSWEHAVDTPLGSGMTLYALVGGVDSQRPKFVSTTLSASTKSPALPTQVLSTATEVVGEGGSSHPCGWIAYLHDPFESVTSTGSVTGTVTVTFDDRVGRMQGMSVIISGTAETFDSDPSYTAQNTQYPGFAIANTHLTSTPGAMLLDLCVSESSTFNDHTAGASQTKLSEFEFGGPKVSTSYVIAGTNGNYDVIRSGAGGPFAGAALITLPIKSGD